VVRDGKKAAAARAALAALWGVHTRVEFLPGDMDDNFAVVEPDGRRSVLKLVHRSTPPAEVDLQVAALTHLAGRIGALEIPTVLPTRSGEPTGRTDDGRIAWRLDFVPGRPLAGVRPRSPALLRDLGRALGRVVEAFGDFDHPAAGREHGWDLARAGGLAAELHHLPDAERRARVAGVLTTYEGLVAPRLGGLPRTVIHGDANDHNVFVEPGLEPARVVGLIDFGDMVRSHRICEAAVAGAYALFDTDDVLVATGALLAGFDEVVGLGDDEIDLFLPLVETRLAMSVLRSARRRGERPDDPYVTVSEADAWKALDRLAGLHPTLARARMRTACGRAGHPRRAGARGLADRPGAPLPSGARAGARGRRGRRGRPLGREPPRGSGPRAGRDPLPHAPDRRGRGRGRSERGRRPVGRGPRALPRAGLPGRPPPDRRIPDGPSRHRPLRAPGHAATRSPGGYGRCPGRQRRAGLRAGSRARAPGGPGRPPVPDPVGTPGRALDRAARGRAAARGRRTPGHGRRRARQRRLDAPPAPADRARRPRAGTGLSGRRRARRARRLAGALARSDPARGTRGARRPCAPLLAGRPRTTAPQGARPEPLPLLPPAPASGARPAGSALGRRRPALSGLLQQRAARGPPAPPRGRGGAPPGRAPQHQHALPARAADPLRRAAVGAASGSARGGVAAQLGLGGQRAGAPHRAHGHVARRRRGARGGDTMATRAAWWR
jgi:Ser/Thr protein kinase RdoA (MazF antagonist)